MMPSFRARVKVVQEFNGGLLEFDPDSSPDALGHYKIIYGETFLGYDLAQQFFYKYGKNKKYRNEAKVSGLNRLFSFPKGFKTVSADDGVDEFEPTPRLGGETDFNFNEEKYGEFLAILEDELSASDLLPVVDALNYCRGRHHSLVNFSLMQAMGNMQGCKGRDRFDRLDKFIYLLNEYFCGRKNLPSDSRRLAKENIKSLEDYLSPFKERGEDGIYDYCNKIYLIEDRSFINRLIKKGNVPIESAEDVIEYMISAQEFWNLKEQRLLTIYGNLEK